MRTAVPSASFSIARRLEGTRAVIVHSRGTDAELQDRLAVIVEREAFPSTLAEVHENVGPLGRCEHQLVERDRCVEKPLIGADLDQRLFPPQVRGAGTGRSIR